MEKIMPGEISPSKIKAVAAQYNSVDFGQTKKVSKEDQEVTLKFQIFRSNIDMLKGKDNML